MDPFRVNDGGGDRSILPTIPFLCRQLLLGNLTLLLLHDGSGPNAIIRETQLCDNYSLCLGCYLPPGADHPQLSLSLCDCEIGNSNQIVFILLSCVSSPVGCITTKLVYCIGVSLTRFHSYNGLNWFSIPCTLTSMPMTTPSKPCIYFHSTHITHSPPQQLSLYLRTASLLCIKFTKPMVFFITYLGSGIWILQIDMRL